MARRLQREVVERVFDLAELEAVFIRRLNSRGLSRKTIEHYESTFTLLHRFLVDARKPTTSKCLTSDVMDEFVLWLRETPTRPWRGDTTRSVYGMSGTLKNMRTFTSWLFEEELILRKPKVPLPKTPQRLFPILSDEDIERVWHCEQLRFRGDLGKRNRALLALMMDTGLRRAEVCGLTVDDVDLTDQLVTVIGKGDKQRRVPFSTACALFLAEWLKARGDDERPLFLLKPAGLQMLFNRIKASSGVDLFHPHSLRHTAATHMVRANMDLHSVKRVLGHSQISTTELYLSLSDKDLREKHAAASPFTAIQSQMEKPKQRRRLSRD